MVWINKIPKRFFCGCVNLVWKYKNLHKSNRVCSLEILFPSNTWIKMNSRNFTVSNSWINMNHRNFIRFKYMNKHELLETSSNWNTWINMNYRNFIHSKYMNKHELLETLYASNTWINMNFLETLYVSYTWINKNC